MKKSLFLLFCLILGASAMAQNKIPFRSADKAECVKSDYTSLKATFSFSGLEANQVETERGALSEIHIEGAYPNGNVGEPQLPMFTRLIAIPTGATPVVTVGTHSETQYKLSDYGIGTLSAMQAPIRKNVEPSTVEYAFSEAAYARNSFNDDPIAMVEVLGTMRGITLGRLIVQPVRYNPAAGTVKVFNDIEVNVDFENGDAASTEEMFKNTFSPAFISVYDQIFNIDMLMENRDAYTDHPDMYNTPVKMLVICYSGFKNNSSLNSWLQWKLQKGYYVDIFYTDETGTTASAIASFIKTKYNASVSAGNAYTYLIVIGDTGQVPQYMTKTIDSSIGQCASDLGYASVNFSSSTSNYFPDMYYSRISVENTTHLTNYMNKVLTYEKFEFTDGGNYLNNVLLVGGWDSNWTSRVAKPTINYGANNYFNSSNTTYGGFSGGTIHAVVSTSSSQGYSGTNHGVYNGINDGACIVNYTAHGDKQEWQVPQFTAAQAATLTNTGKYFFCIGNCCLTGNFNNTTTSYSPGSTIGTTASFGETMMRVPNAGAIAYVGCSPYSYWYEDFYWAVGAHSYSAGNAPSVSGSTKGVYDVMFMDNYWNSASALLYVGNLAVQQAVSNNNTNSAVTDGDCNNSAHYYFQFYHTFGDGSVMPYITKPEANTVTIPSTVTPGTTSITVNAVAGSYVAVTDNSSVIYGVAEANSSGVATVNFTNAIPGTGTLYVMVTRQQYQPYSGTISIVGGTQYDITVNQPQHGTISAPSQAYANSTVTLTATPETGYCLSSWDVRDTSNHSITVTNNQFTMPESNVTVTATFVQGLAITLAPATNGTISADPMYALQGNTITLTATPATGYNFDSWVVYKTGDVNTTVNVTGNTFTMPNYDVTVVGIFSAPQGGEVTIGSGTGTTNGNCLPTSDYYNYDLSQQIYTKAELGEAGTITAISFYFTGSSNTKARNLNIYMSHTSASSITSWSTVSSNQQVYSGTKTFSNGWNTITLTTPFAYNGTDNLLLTVDDNTGSYGSDTKFYTYSTGSTSRAIYYRNDYTNPDPTGTITVTANNLQYNAQMKVTKEVPSNDGYLSVSPTSLGGFTAVAGSVASDPQSVAVVGSNLSSNLIVTAPTGYEVCATQNGTYAGTLTLMPSNGNVRQMVYVRLSSNVAPASYNGSMTFASGTASVTVALSGTVTPGSGEQYTVTVTASPAAGGTVTGGGTYYENSTATLTATPNEHYTFGGWQRNGSIESTQNPYSITVNGNASYTAIFNEMEQYSVTVNQAEGGTITANPTLAYAGEIITLDVATNEGYYFVEWNVKDAGNQTIPVTDNQFTMPEGNVTVTAVFSQGFVITLTQTENGTVAASQTTAQPGDVITITATPDSECVFSTWYVYKTGDTRTVVTVVNDAFTMPAYDVTVMAVFIPTVEEEVEIGSGNNANAYLPTYTRDSYSLTEQIYTAAEVGTEGFITAIAFKVSNNKSASRNLDIYMQHTNLSAFTSTTGWETMGTVYKVFSGNVTFSASGWTTITLDTPFEYDGQRNLNLCVVDNTGSSLSSSNYLQFYTYSTGANRALRANGSSQYTSVNFSDISSYTGTYVTSNNQVTFTVSVPGSAESLSASPNAVTGLSYLQGQGPSEARKIDVIGVELSNDITLTAPDGFEISDTEEGPYAQTLTITRETTKSRNVTNWDFEGSFLNWTTIDNDGDGHNWAVSSATMSNYTNGHSGTDALTSQSYISGTGALTPDNWLVSPQVTLGGTFSMWACAQDANWPSEHFGIFVSTTSNTNVNTFTLLNEWTLTAKGGGKGDSPRGTRASGSWYQFTVDLSAYAGQTGYIAVRHYNCTDVFYINVDDFTLDTDAGFTPDLPVVITPATVFVRMKAGLGGGTHTGTLTATTGEITSNIALSGEVSQTSVETTVTLYKGWTWWSTNLDITLAQLEEAMGNNGVMIKSQNEYATFGGTVWDNSEMPSELDVRQMYKIKVNATDEITLSASPVNPADYPITLYKGYNWIGFPCSQAISLDEAFVSGFTPTTGDMIKSQEGYAIYNGNAWETEDLEAFEPGQGYIYKSNATGTQTFTFPSSAKGDAVNIKHPTTWTPKAHAYADNMCLMATVNLDGTPAVSDNIEVGAFVNGECRGAVRLKYIERLQQYVAFLTVAGLNGETVSFSILDDGRTLKANEEFEFIPNAFIGKLDQPVVLHAGMPGQLNLFPNPTEKGQTVRIEVAFADLEGATVEVFNTLGALVRSEILSKNAMELNAFETAGLYTVRITDREGNVHFGKLVVR